MTPKKLVYVIHGDPLSGKNQWVSNQQFPHIFDVGNYSNSKLIEEVEALFAKSEGNTICIKTIVSRERFARRVQSLKKRFDVTTVEFRRHR